MIRSGPDALNAVGWLRANGQTGLSIATYNASSPRKLRGLIPLVPGLRLLIGVPPLSTASPVDPTLAPDVRWAQVLMGMEAADQARLLKKLRVYDEWVRAGAAVRIALPHSTNTQNSLMHVKAYISVGRALVGSANCTLQGLLGQSQSEVLVEVTGPSYDALTQWFERSWEEAWPLPSSIQPTTGDDDAEGSTNTREVMMAKGAQQLLGHWLGTWSAWALNGNGVIAYPHQLQAVDWIKPDGRSYLLGDEVGLGKTFTAALLWVRHRMLYGDRARLIYITKPSLLIDAMSAFADVLGADEFLKGPDDARRPGDIQPQFSVLHGSTRVWDILPDERGRRRNKDHPIKAMLKDGRYRVRPASFADRLGWINHHQAKQLHNAVTISQSERMADKPMTFVSIDTLRGLTDTIPHVFERVRQPGYAPLIIVDESHGLGRTTDRRKAISELLWGQRGGPRGLYGMPGSLVVFMTGTPVHPTQAETLSRLGLLDVQPDATPHFHSLYENQWSEEARDMLKRVRDRAVLRKKESVTMSGQPDGTRIFPKRLVYPFRNWPEPADGGPPAARDDLGSQAQDVLLAVDRYVASEASHGAKLVSKIRSVLRSARALPEVRRLANEKEASEDGVFADRVLQLAREKAASEAGELKLRWEALRLAIEAARTYEDLLKDARLCDLTWKWGQDADDNKVKILLFTKVGWVATVYDSLKKGGTGATTEASDDDVPEDDEETAGDIDAVFDSASAMLAAAQAARGLAESYLDPVAFDDESKIRFSMLVALLEGHAKRAIWPPRYSGQTDEDRFGWGLDRAGEQALKNSLLNVQSPLQLDGPWVIHARYIHSVVDTAVRLQLRYGSESGEGPKLVVGIIIGDTPNHKRDEIKGQFAAGKLDIVCMSDAGAEGINLQRSNRIVLLDVPVSPGRIEQIAGRVHRLGSTRAAQVTLLLPPGAFGSKVFDALRAAAGIVFRVATASPVPSVSRESGWPAEYYYQRLAEREACLITAVAETSGLIRTQDNKDALMQIVRAPVTGDGKPNAGPLVTVIRQGWELVQQQQQNFQRADVATQSDLMPEIGDLVQALCDNLGAHVRTSESDRYRVPVALVTGPSQYATYGDLITEERAFEYLEVEPKRGQQLQFWFARDRFLPSDAPSTNPVTWLGVMGNRWVEDTLRQWRREGETLGERSKPAVWSNAWLMPGSVLAFMGVRNLASGTGKIEAAEAADRQVHVLIGLGKADSPMVWRPFFARGSVTPRDRVAKDTWLSDAMSLDHRWAAELLRRVCGLKGDVVQDLDAKQGIAVLETVIEEAEDEDTGETLFRLRKAVWEGISVIDAEWWGGGKNRRCEPQFCFVSVGPPV